MMRSTGVRGPVRRLAGVVAVGLAVPLLGSGSVAAVPAVDPHPAAPVGGCAVTQTPGTTYSSAREVRLQHGRTVVDRRRVSRTPRGWRVVLEAEVVWRGTATVTATSTYASADCDVAEQEVSATRSYASRVRVGQKRTATARTKKAAVRAARVKLRKATRKHARLQVVTLAEEAAGLKARRRFLAWLPTRDEAVPAIELPKVTAAQACPKRLARGTGPAAQAEGRFVPQFGKPDRMWVCTYTPLVKGAPKLVDRTAVKGAKRRALMAGIRSLELRDPAEDVVCPSDVGLLGMVAHVGERGLTGVVVEDFGCRDAALTPDPANVPRGATTSRGVPSGTYGSSALLWHALRAL